MKKRKVKAKLLTFQSLCPWTWKKGALSWKNTQTPSKPSRRRKNHLRAESGRTGNQCPNQSTSIQKSIQRALKAQELCRQCRGKNVPSPLPATCLWWSITPVPSGKPCIPVPMKTSRSGNGGNSICWIRPVCRKCSVPAHLCRISGGRGNRKAVKTIRKMAQIPRKTGAFISMGLPGWGRPCWRPCTPKKSSSREKPSGS